jgi:hypothetical protein
VTVCTRVTPPNVVLLPFQNALVARRGNVEGRSSWTLGVRNDEVEAEMDAGDSRGGDWNRVWRGEEACCPLPRREDVFLSALISCCSGAFLDFVGLSSAKIASMRRSRKRGDILLCLQICKYKEVELLERGERIP